MIGSTSLNHPDGNELPSPCIERMLKRQGR